MKENDIHEVSKLIQRNEMDLLNVISKNKEHLIQVIQIVKFQDIMRSKDIIKSGEEFTEKFIDLVQLNDDHDDVIVINKLHKLISKIQSHKYFTFFGWEMRTFEWQKNINKSKKISKRHSHIVNPEFMSRKISFESDIKNKKLDNSEKDIDKKIKVIYQKFLIKSLTSW